MKKKLLLLLTSCACTIVFTFILFNYLWTDQLIWNYVISFSFYTLLGWLMYRKSGESKLFVFLVVFLPSLALDLTVFIEGSDLVPLRFPFYTTFPLSGTMSGIVFSTGKQKRKSAVLIAVISIFAASYFYLIPEMIWIMFSRHKPTVKEQILQATFIDAQRNPVILQNVMVSKVQLLELFFVDCLPCEQKLPQIMRLCGGFNNSDFQVIMICDGKASPFEEFTAYVQQHSHPGVSYLYDKNNVLNSMLDNFSGYPTEFLVSNQKVYSSFSGFDKKIQTKYYNNELSKISYLVNHR